MKKLLLILLAVGMISAQDLSAQLKYVDATLARGSVVRTSNIPYQVAYSVLTGTPKADTFKFDLYASNADTASKRPLIIFCHTGSFLPRYLNQLPTGARDDSATVEIATQFAMRGYVVAVMSYRLGWNPGASTEDGRKSSIINAAYKAVQDLHTCVRFFKKSIKEDGNPYKIDSTRFCTGGQGTGGYVTLVHATLSSQADIKIDKFIDYTVPSNPVPMVNDTVWGDRFGYKLLPTTPYCIENHKGYTSGVRISFEFGGAIGDSSWIDAGETQMICAHAQKDKFAPYKTGMVTLPSNGAKVVVVSGGHDIMWKVDKLGNNSSYKGKVYDNYTVRANRDNDGLEGLFPIVDSLNAHGAWEWWDTAKIKMLPSPPYNPTIILASGDKANPLHKTYGKARALLFIDSLVGYFAPRIAVSMGYYTSVGIDEKDLSSNVTVFPNPAKDQVIIHSNWTNNDLKSIAITDLNGRVVQRIPVFENHTSVNLSLPTGVYLVQMQFARGTGVKKLIVE